MTRMKLALFALVPACGTTIAYSPLQSSPRPLTARAPASVAVFERAPDRPFVAVGVIETQPDPAYSEYRLTAKLRQRMRAEAARQGCDAIVMMAPAPVATAVPIGEPAAATSYRATCVVFTDETASR
jgi:hypothetical protein